MIYFIQGDRKFVKIGVTANLNDRAKALQTANPFDLKVIAALNGDTKTEAGLHTLFSHLRYNGEWFKYTDELKWYVITIKANPTDNNIYSLYQKALKLRISNKSRRLGPKHKLSKRIAFLENR